MEQLNIIYRNLIENTRIDFKRYLFDRINWDARLIAITGARGTGKTTMMLQKVKLYKEMQQSMYVSLDNIYFTGNTVFDFVGYLYKYGIRFLYLDEVHKYNGWSQEIKNIYDSYPDLKIVFSGSSMLDLYKGIGDLSRRVVPYVLHGLSFREYLNLETGGSFSPFSINQVIENKLSFKIENPLVLFKQYLRNGYYPFYKENDYAVRLSGVLNTVLEQDIPKYMDLQLSTINKLKQLLVIIAENVPFKPNYVKIAEILGVSRNSVPNYFSYLERAGLIMILRDETSGLRRLGKVEKVYLNNTNISFVLNGENANMGTLRETFFMNQVMVNNQITASKTGDFKSNNIVYEIGGKSKTKKQIKDIENAILVKDDIEYGFGNTIPLWHFGVMY